MGQLVLLALVKTSAYHNRQPFALKVFKIEDNGQRGCLAVRGFAKLES